MVRSISGCSRGEFVSPPPPPTKSQKLRTFTIYGSPEVLVISKMQQMQCFLQSLCLLQLLFTTRIEGWALGKEKGDFFNVPSLFQPGQFLNCCQKVVKSGFEL